MRVGKNGRESKGRKEKRKDGKKGIGMCLVRCEVGGKNKRKSKMKLRNVY